MRFRDARIVVQEGQEDGAVAFTARPDPKKDEFVVTFDLRKHKSLVEVLGSALHENCHVFNWVNSLNERKTSEAFLTLIKDPCWHGINFLKLVRLCHLAFEPFIALPDFFNKATDALLRPPTVA